MRNANEAKVAAQEALTRSFVRTIGVSSSSEIPERDEQAALWELAELGPANVPVRKRVIDHWFGSEQYLYRAFKRRMQGLHAAVGLNVALRYYSASKATEMADRLAKALENQQEHNAQRLQNLGDALAALAARMESKEAARVAQVLAKALEDPKTEAHRLWALNKVLAAFAARMEPKEAARVAQVLAKALEDPKTMVYQLSDLANALAGLAARMESKEEAAGVSSRGAQVLAKALEDPKTDTYQLSDLANALAALAARMKPKEAASVSSRGAQVLAKALEDPQRTDALPLSSLGWTLGQLSSRIPSARQTRCVALSILMNQVPTTPKVDEVEPEKRAYLIGYHKGIGKAFEAKAEKQRKQLADLFALIEAQELAEVLKWPFCVGEAEKIALAELENKTGRKFGGDIWKFVEQAPSLGIKDLDAPAKRPKVEDALKELKSVATGGEVARSSGGK